MLAAWGSRERQKRFRDKKRDEKQLTLATLSDRERLAGAHRPALTIAGSMPCGARQKCFSAEGKQAVMSRFT